MANNNPSVRSFGTEQGRSGTYFTHGIISREEYNADLIGQSGKKIYDIMRRSDSSIHSTLQVCKLPIIATTWTIEAASDDDADQYIANFIKNELFNRNVNWHDFLRSALTMFDFGFSVFEKTYELTEFEGQLRVGIKELGSRKQRSILYWQMKNQKPGVQQQLLGSGIDNNSPSGLIDIPMEKLIVFTNEKEGDNYEGISLLRFAYKDWDIKDKLTLVHAIALEKMAIGIPVITPTATVNPQEQKKARESIRQMRANEESFIEKPAGWDLTMLDMKSQTTKDILPTLEWLDKNISKSVLAQFLELGTSGSGGSRALSQDHSALFMLSEEAAAKNIANTIQESLIKQLCDLNFSDLPNGYPKITFGKIGDDDVAKISDAVNKLMTAGALTPDPALEDKLRETLHLPALADDIHEAYDKMVEEDPTQFIKLPNTPAPAPFGGEPTTDTPTPKPKSNVEDVKNDDDSLEEDKKTQASRRKRLISDVLTEFSRERA